MQDLNALELRRKSLKETSDDVEFSVVEARHRLSKAHDVIFWCNQMKEEPTKAAKNEVENARNAVREAETSSRIAKKELTKLEVQLDIFRKKNREEENLLKFISDADIVITEGYGYLRVKHDEKKGYVDFSILHPSNNVLNSNAHTIRIGNSDNIRDTIAILKTIADTMEADQEGED